MSEFWENIIRYPRFFISSLLGLILVILTPFRNLTRTPKFKLLSIASFLMIIIIFWQILYNMLGY